MGAVRRSAVARATTIEAEGVDRCPAEPRACGPAATSPAAGSGLGIQDPVGALVVAGRPAARAGGGLPPVRGHGSSGRRVGCARLPSAAIEAMGGAARQRSLRASYSRNCSHPASSAHGTGCIPVTAAARPTSERFQAPDASWKYPCFGRLPSRGRTAASAWLVRRLQASPPRA